MKCFCLLTFMLFLSTRALAIDFEDGVFPELVTSARALAMGNAFVSKADDASAVFYNPAGLGSVRFPHLHLSNFGIETNKGSIDAVSGNSVTDIFGNAPKMFGTDGIRQVLLKSPGTLAHTRVHALPNFTSRYFSLGYMLAKRTRGIVNDTTSSTGYEFADRLDHGPYAALNISLFGGIIKAGTSVLYLKRKELLTSADPKVSTSSLESNYKKGSAVITTFGGKITLPLTFLPTFAGTIHNGFGQDFKSEGGAGAPAKIPMSYDVGFSLTPQIGNNSRVHLEVNMKDISNQYKTVSSTRKLLFGAEFDFYRVFFFRLGYGDGFGSAGLGIKSRKLEFDLTTYAVDTTTASFRGHEDRRFALSISSGF